MKERTSRNLVGRSSIVAGLKGREWLLVMHLRFLERRTTWIFGHVQGLNSLKNPESRAKIQEG